MKTSLYNKLIKYSKFSSWLIYDDDGNIPSDVIKKDDNLNTRYMFIALASSSSKNITGPYTNFHKGRNDGRLIYLSNYYDVIKGCYITDFVKYKADGKTIYTNAHGNGVVADVKDDKELFDVNFKVIQEEYEILGNPTIVLLGSHIKNIIEHYKRTDKNVKKFFSKYASVPHYSFHTCSLCSKKTKTCNKCYLNKVKENIDII